MEAKAMVTLTQKETMLLKDLKSHEELCIKKYTKYASETKDEVLKKLFQKLANDEQTHFETIQSILNGQVPAMNQKPGQKMMTQDWKSNNANQEDFDLCHDLLSTEKFVSSTYNTVIFECQDTAVRQALNHIQKEEQEHGEKIYQYLKQNGGYSA